jgi:hypothetical protein
MRKAFFIIATMICLQTAASAPQKNKKESPLISSAKQSVLQSMKDPDSTQFKDVVIVGGISVCGLVNSKNSYGGYGGFKKFLWQDGRELKIESNGDYPYWWEDICLAGVK